MTYLNMPWVYEENINTEYGCVKKSMFKAQFKYYKNNQVDEDDLEKLLIPGPIIEGENVSEEALLQLGLNSPNKWKLYNHQRHNGLILLRNVFTSEGQWYWIRRCVTGYPSPPNPNNLAQLGLLSNEENWFDVCLNYPNRKDSLFRKIRWVTLGYHHNWDTKLYSEAKKGLFPDDLADLSRIVAKFCMGADFTAQAAIVNYYYDKSTISGHVDHSEPNVDAPLLSFSFGHSALFLVGGLSEDEPASPLMIKSGDVVIMSGQTRLSIHGVPRILPAVNSPWVSEDNLKSTSEVDEMVQEYVSQARINMNVRQVLYFGDKTLKPSD